MSLARFGFRPTERFLYEYDFTAGWQMKVRVERVIPRQRPAGTIVFPFVSPASCGGPQVYAERRRDALGWAMADDVDTVVAILRRVSDGDAAVLNANAMRHVAARQ